MYKLTDSSSILLGFQPGQKKNIKKLLGQETIDKSQESIGLDNDIGRKSRKPTFDGRCTSMGDAWSYLSKPSFKSRPIIEANKE